MKTLILILMTTLITLSFARDYEYNERRDIVKPMEEQWEKLKKLTPEEWAIEKELMRINIEKYKDFHWELDRSDKGENSER